MVEKYIETLREIASVTEPLKSSKDESALDKLKSKVKADLPDSVESFYKKYDGEADVEGFAAGFELLPISRVIAEFDFLKKSGIEFDAIGTDAISENPVSKNKWIPFAFDGSDCFLVIDLSPSKKGVVGQIIGLDMESDNAYVFANSLDDFFEKLTKLVVDGKLTVEAGDNKAAISEISGHFFNRVTEYAIMDESIQNVDVILEDEFWIKKFEKQLKNKDGKSVVSSRAIGKTTGSFRITNNPQRLSCKPFEYMDNVKELIIHHCELFDFESISKMKNLTTLYLIDCTTDSCNVAALAEAPKLKKLSLGVIKEHIDMKKLAKSKSLKELSIRELDGVSFCDLCEFSGLTSLTIEGGNPEEYEFLSKLGKLKTLKIRGVQLDNLDFLHHMPKLEEFEMHIEAQNEDGLMAIRSLTKLKSFIYPVKDLVLYKGVPTLEEAGIAHVNNGQFEAFKDTKLNSFLVLGDGDEDLMEEAGKIAEELTSYGLRIMSYGSVG